MNAFRFERIIGHETVAFGQLFRRFGVVFLYLRYLGPYVGQYEELGVVDALRQYVVPFVGKVDGVVFLVYHEEKVVHNLRHATVVVGHVYVLRLLHEALIARFAEQLYKGLVFGQTLVGAVEHHAAFVLLACGEKFAGVAQQCGDVVFLERVQFLHIALVLLEELVVALRHGARYDKGCAGVVYEHRVDLVDNGELVFTLYQIARRGGHVVAQIVETELVVGTVCHVCGVCLATGFGVGLVFVYAVYS